MWGISRIGKLWDAGFEVGRTAVNTVVDLAEAPFTEDEYDGFLDTMWGITSESTGNQLENLFGPEGVGGVLIGAIPEPVRDIGNQTLEQLETAYREGIAEPSSTLMTMASLGEAEGSGGFFGDDWGVWTNPEKWKLAYKIAQNRSPGQAFALAWATDDILDKEQVTSAEGERWFSIVSGTWDAAHRFFLSPEILAGGTVMTTRALNKRSAFNKYFEDGKGFSKFSDDLDSLADTTGASGARAKDTKRSPVGEIEERDLDSFAGAIKEKYFAKHHEGDVIATELARAHIGGPETGYRGGKESVELVMRYFMGETSVLSKIEQLEDASTFHRLNMLWDESNTITQLTPPGKVGGQMQFFDDAQLSDDVAEGLLKEMDEAHVASAFRSIDEAVKPSIRKNFVHNDRVEKFYRSKWNLATRPVRVIRDMRPQHFVWAGDPKSGDHITRFMREADFSPAEIRKFRGEWARADSVTRSENLARSIQTKAIRRVAQKNVKKTKNMTAKQYKKAVDDLIEDFTLSNESVMRHLKDVRKYDADKGLSQVKYVDPDTKAVEILEVPLTPAQLKQTFSLIDIKKVNREMMKEHRWTFGGRMEKGLNPAYRGLSATKGGIQMGLGAVMRHWRPAVLLRPSWVLRVVGDEQMRMAAKIGTLNRMADFLLVDQPKYARKVFEKAVVKTGQTPKELKKASAFFMGKRMTTSGLMGTALAGPIGGATAVSLSFARNTNLLRGLRKTLRVRSKAQRLESQGKTGEAKELLQTIDEGPLRVAKTGDVHSVEVAGAFGDALAPELAMQRANSANRGSQFLLGNNEIQILNDQNIVKGGWKDVPVPFGKSKNAQKEFSDNWERVVNDQWANTPVGKIAFNQAVDPQTKKQELIDWFYTPEGQDFAKHVGHRFSTDVHGQYVLDDIEVWADSVIAATSRMVKDADVADLLTKGRVTLDDVKKIADEKGVQWQDLVGDIHGQESFLIGENDWRNMYQRMVNKLFDRLGTVTTDNLSRNPYFTHVYNEDILRRLEPFKDASGGYVISAKGIKTLQASSRRKALNDTRELLYDLAEKSQLADMVGNMMPFFNAYQEVLTRWAGLAIDNPVFVTRMMETLKAKPETEWFHSEKIDGEDYLIFPIPEFAKDILEHGRFGKAFADLGEMRFRTNTMNMVTQIAPGVGPAASILASELVIDNPQFEDAFKMILPFGPARGEGLFDRLADSFQPAYMKRVTDALRETRSYQSSAAMLMITRMAQIADGDRDHFDYSDGAEVAKFIAEVKEDAKNLHYLRSIATAFSPASVNFYSMYQPYIDKYREFKREDYRTADRRFFELLAEEGSEGFFALSASFSRNMEGIPATLEAEEARNKYIDMVQKYPDVAGLIIGDEGGGVAKHSATIYEKQLREDTSPGSGIKRKERKPLKDILTDVRVKEGWEEYGRINDIIYNEMRARGLPNLRVKDAADLKNIKAQIIEQLAERYPLWHADYLDRDETKWVRRIDGMRAIVKDDRLSKRDDIQLISEYLEARDLITGVLAQRASNGGSTRLDSGSNADLQDVWDQIVEQMKENPTFSEVLWRWLEFDYLTSDTWTPAQIELKEKK